MKQYVVIAHDGTDDGAPERRQTIRPTHLEGAKAMKGKKQFVFGGAILDNEQRMKGSVMIVQFESQEEFDKWYQSEPYITGGVWKEITVYPFRQAEI
jgi:uncharacterized protein YciI